MKIDIQRLRNLTTSRLHTKIDFVYEDLGMIIGEGGLMTHMLPRANRAVQPWLRRHVLDARFWEDKYDPEHTGEIELPDPTEADREEMFHLYAAMPNPLIGKQVISVQV